MAKRIIQLKHGRVNGVLSPTVAEVLVDYINKSDRTLSEVLETSIKYELHRCGHGENLDLNVYYRAMENPSPEINRKRAEENRKKKEQRNGQ